MNTAQERYARAAAALDRLLEHDVTERERLLASATAGDERLRRLVGELLAAHTSVGRLDRLADRLRPRPPADPAVAQALASRYRVLRELGCGGTAVVYLAVDLERRRAVAIKVLDPGLSHALGPGSFLREIEVAGGLHHPHILPLYDSGEAAGVPYFVMPLVEGESLRDRLRREGRLPLAEALAIAQEVADALRYAHAHGVLHGDVKPENILLESGHAVVADFGIARAIGARIGADGDSPAGTPAYMSPEQAVPAARLDGRTDVYGLGCVLFEMLAGRPPFTGDDPGAILALHALARVPRLRALRPTVPAAVEGVVRRALAKSPGARFQTMAGLSSALAGASPAGHGPRTRWSAIVVLIAAGVLTARLVLRRRRLSRRARS